jgi:hypothetical protein
MTTDENDPAPEDWIDRYCKANKCSREAALAYWDKLGVDDAATVVKLSRVNSLVKGLDNN